MYVLILMTLYCRHDTIYTVPEADVAVSYISHYVQVVGADYVHKDLRMHKYSLLLYTVEAPIKGHLGTRASVLYSEVAFIRRLEMC